jgi:hypothetical protein
VPAPVILPHIAKCRRDTTLRCNCVAAGWKYFRYASGIKPGMRHTESGAQARTACSDNNDIMIMVYDLICRNGRRLGHKKTLRDIEKMHFKDDNDAQSRPAETEEAVGKKQGEFGVWTMDIILYHHLQPKLSMIKSGYQEKHHEQGVQRRGKPTRGNQQVGGDHD